MPNPTASVGYVVHYKREEGTKMPNNKGKKQPAGVGMVPSKTVLGEFMRARRLELDMRQVELNRLIPRSGYQNSLGSLS